jgi:hypothetical protein
VLTLSTRLAWDLGGVDRVWLHTSSFDHPHALHNYRSRGFRQFQVVHRPREMPGVSYPGPATELASLTLMPVPRRVPGSRRP